MKNDRLKQLEEECKKLRKQVKDQAKRIRQLEQDLSEEEAMRQES